MVRFAEDGQSDGYNDHATRYNTSVSKSIEIVDTYGGVPSCLLFGSMVSKSDGTTTKVEDLNVGDEILTVSLHCLLYTSPSPRDRQKSRMPSSA